MTQYQMHIPTGLNEQTSVGELDSLRAQHDAIIVRWNKGYDYLAELGARVGQDSPEFEKHFARWLEIDAEYRRLDDLLYGPSRF